MEKNTDLEIVEVSFENGLNKRLGHLLIREKFFKKDETLIKHFLENGGSFSSVPMVDHEKVILAAIPPKFGADEVVVDEDENEQFIAILKEKGVSYLIPDVIELANESRKQLPITFKEMLKKYPINKQKNPKQYEILRKRVMEPAFFPLVYALTDFFKTQPLEIEWKNGRKLYLLATMLPKLTEKDLLRQGYFELLGEFCSAFVDQFVQKLATRIHYAIHLIPEEWKAVILITHSPIH